MIEQFSELQLKTGSFDVKVIKTSTGQLLYPLVSGGYLGQSYTDEWLVDKYSTPGWHSQLALGEPVLNPYSTEGSKIQTHIGTTASLTSLSGGDTSYILDLDGPIVNPVVVESYTGVSDLSDHQVLAATAAEAKMLSGAADTAVSIIEARKTLDMVSNRVGQLMQILLRARRSIRNGSAVRVIRGFLSRDGFDNALNLWMEYRYGWRPLLYDIASHQQALENILNGDVNKRWHVRAVSDPGAETVVHADVSLGIVSPYQFRPISLTGDIDIVPIRAGSLAGYYYRVNPRTQASLYWLGFESPLKVIWDLVPYSFVADWFANVGDYLTTIGSIPVFIRDEVGFLSTTQSELVRWRLKQGTYNNHLGTPVTVPLSGSGSINNFSFSRQNLIPGTHTGLRFDINLSAEKLVDSAIMLKNIMVSNREDVRRRL